MISKKEAIKTIDEMRDKLRKFNIYYNNDVISNIKSHIKSPADSGKPKMKKKFHPQFRPSVVEVILDEGVKKMKGHYVRLPITSIQYDANFMRVYVWDRDRSLK